MPPTPARPAVTRVTARHADYAACRARPAAGPETPRALALPIFGGPGLLRIRASRWALGVSAGWPNPADTTPKRRRERPVSGRLEDVQKVLTTLPGGRTGLVRP